MAASRLCSISNCDKPAHRRGLCNAHYLRLLRHGDPLGGGQSIKRRAPICTVPECNKKHFGKGFCSAHYGRFIKYGDPLGGRTDNGEPKRFLDDVVLPYDGQDCLIWPYATVNGYGCLRVDGKTRLVTRIACEAANGPPPTREHEARHLCGQGHNGCCAPSHLTWSTHAENMADVIIHGTATRGLRNSQTKLTESDVREIRHLLTTTNLSQTEVAKRFNVSRGNICHIKRRISWGWLY